MRRPLLSHVNPSCLGRKFRLQEEPSAEGFLCGEVFPWLESWALGVACWAELVEADKPPQACTWTPVPIASHERPGMAGLGEEEGCSPERPLLYVTLPTFR